MTRSQQTSGDVTIVSPAISESQKDPEPSLMLSSQVAAGFPISSGDSDFEPLDLNTYLIKKPHATFFMRVRGDSMVGAGILEGDLLVVEKGLDPKENAIVIAAIQDEMMVKRLVKQQGQFVLIAENPSYQKTPVKEGIEIWGIVTGVLRKF